MTKKIEVRIYTCFLFLVGIILIFPFISTNNDRAYNKNTTNIFSFDKDSQRVQKLLKSAVKQEKDESKTNQKYLLEISTPDLDYKPQAVKIEGKNREILGHLIMGEAGGEGFIGCALVAQTIRDTIIYENNYDIESIRKSYKYDAPLDNTVNQEVFDAITYIFDEGNAVVQHNLLYFYATSLCNSDWHESQNYVVTYNTTRFFDKSI